MVTVPILPPLSGFGVEVGVNMIFGVLVGLITGCKVLVGSGVDVVEEHAGRSKKGRVAKKSFFALN